MKIRILIFFLAIVFITNTCEAQKLKGQITFSDTTVPFTFRMHQHAFKFALVELQHGMWYKEVDGRRRRVKPKDDVLKIQYFLDGDTATLHKVRRTDNIKQKHWRKGWEHLFLLNTVDGPNRLYRLYRDVHVGVLPIALSVAFYQKENKGDLFTPEDKDFKSALSIYFSDCPILAKKISDGEYGTGELLEGEIEGVEFDKEPDEKILIYYNNRCSN